MSLFTKTTVKENDIEYIRWVYNNEYYVAEWLSVKVVSDVTGIEREKLPKYRSCNWYAKVKDLQVTDLPTSLTLFYDDIKNTVIPVVISKDKSERALKHWFKDFQKLLELTPAIYEQVSGNLYGRFANSSKAGKRIFVFSSEEIAREANNFIIAPNKKRKIHTDFEVTTSQPSDSSLVGMHSQFCVYCTQSKTQSITLPDPKSVATVHNNLFNNNYTQKNATRSLSALVTRQQARIWYKTLRKPQQKTVMNGNSANTVAAKLNLPKLKPKFSYEWLHLVAHSLGPSEGNSTPQNIDNLILGTSAANTQMLMHEGLIQRETLGNKLTVDINVIVDCFKIGENLYTKWLATKIIYKYKIMSAESTTPIYSETINFNPFHSITPTFAEYLLFNELNKFSDHLLLNKKRKIKDYVDKPTKRRNVMVAALVNKEADITMQGLSFDNIEPCLIINNEYQPVIRSVALTANAVTAKPLLPVTNTPGGHAFIANTSLLDQKDLTANLAILNNGIKQATIPLAEDNFTFDQLFNNFECDNVDLFVLSDVSVHLRQTENGTDNSILFNGTLDMDNDFLSVIKNFLKIEKGLLISGEIDIGTQDLTTKLEPDYINLTSAANFHLPVVDDVVLKSAALQLSVHPKLDFIAMKKSWTCDTYLTGKIEISNIAPSAVDLNCIVSYVNNTLHVEASCSDVVNLFNINGFILDELQLKLDVGQQNDLQVLAFFTPSFRSYEFYGLLTPTYAGLYASATEFTLDDLADIFSSVTGKQALLPDFDVTFDKVMIGLANADCTIDNVSLQQGLTLMCQLTVHGHQCAATVLITKDGISFTGSLGKIDIGPVHLKQATLKMSIYDTASGKPTEFAIISDAIIENIEVICQVSYEKIQQTWNCVLYAGIEAKSFGVSTVFPAAKDSFVDSLKFSKIAFIYSTQNCTTQNSEYSFTVNQGLQLVGSLEEIPTLTSLIGSKHVGLVFNAHFGASTDITIAMPDTRLHLGGSVTCDPFSIRIFITPKPSFQLIFGLDVSIAKQHDPLHFDFALDINPIEAIGSATMKNWWQDPFGIQGLKIGPAVALQVGIIYEQFLTTGIPSEFGIAGGLAIGTVEAAMAVNISEDPTHEILMGKLNELSPKDLVAFAETITELKLGEEAIPNFFEFRNIELYCAPSGGTIGTITYQAGFSFSGDLTLFEKHVTVYALCSDTGVKAKGEFDKIDIGLLKITGENGKNATLDLELTNEKQLVHIDGAFEFLGSGAGIYVDISTHGIHFQFEQQFVGLIKYTLKGDSQGTITNPASLDFTLLSEFDNDLTDYLKNTLSQKIHDAINTVDTKLEDAQKSVNDAEKTYKVLYDPLKKKFDQAQADADQYLKKCQQQVVQEKQKYTAALEQAKADLATAKKTYDDAFKSAKDAVTKAQASYDAAMRTAQNSVTKAQADYDAAMKSAENAVTDAKNAYDNTFNSAVNEVRNARNNVNSLQKEIDSAVHELEHLEWYEVPYKGPYLSAEIAGLEVAMRTAQGALFVAEGVLEGIKTGSDYTAWQAAKEALEAVRYGGKYGALETAKTTLSAVQTGADYAAFQSAQQTLKAIQTGSDYTIWQLAKQTLQTVETSGRAALTLAEQALNNVGRSTVYIALQAAKVSLEAIKQGSAAVAFESAKAALEGVKQGSKTMLNLAEYISKHAGDLINVKKVALSSNLKAIEKGDLFNAQLDVSIFDHDHNWTIQFDVNDVAGFIEALFKKALDEAIRAV
jgi:hypothetical protein